jgi:hypothetical protein
MIQDGIHRLRGHHSGGLIPGSLGDVSPLGQQPGGEITTIVELHNEAAQPHCLEEYAVATQTTSTEHQGRFAVQHAADLFVRENYVLNSLDTR